MIARGAGLRSQLSDTWIYAIDAALSAVGLTVAEQMRHAPYAVFGVVPLLGLLAVFARERVGRLHSLLELNHIGYHRETDAYRSCRGHGGLTLAPVVAGTWGARPRTFRVLRPELGREDRIGVVAGLGCDCPAEQTEDRGGDHGHQDDVDYQ
ncbi:MAG: hypothetical protein ACRDQH_11025 [Pseudonocardiaceae bacterium]